jgi:branched-chain amino acid transport system permease protein
MDVIAGATQGLPVIPDLFAPERWILWLGVLFILSVYFFPTGVVGRMRGTNR